MISRPELLRRPGDQKKRVRIWKKIPEKFPNIENFRYTFLL
jgi:hypothetical protein